MADSRKTVLALFPLFYQHEMFYPWIWPAVWKMSGLGKAELHLLFTDLSNEFFILKYCSSLKRESVVLAS